MNSQMINAELRQFVRFCIVGGTCAMIDAAVFYTVRLFAPYQIALVSGYLISLGINYLLTVYWTFRTESSVSSLIGIVGAHLFNLFVVRMGLMMLFVELLGIKDSIAYLPMAAISAVTNYLVIRTVVKYSKRVSEGGRGNGQASHPSECHEKQGIAG